MSEEKTTKVLAEMLNGRKYGDEFTLESVEYAKKFRLVIVYGASDDLIEFEGAFRDEAGCWEGRDVAITREGVFNEDCDNEECPHEVELQDACTKIKAIWDRDGISWQYETDMPHETFEIMEDGDVYCRGIVFKLSDVKAT